MVCKLRTQGLFDRSEYESGEDVMKSLKHLHKRDDLLFCMDSAVFTFLAPACVADPISDGCDLSLASSFYNITEKLASISHMCATLPPSLPLLSLIPI